MNEESTFGPSPTLAIVSPIINNCSCHCWILSISNRWRCVQPIDIIHLHGHRHLLNNLVVRWAKRRGIPYVFTANGTLRRHERKVRFKKAWDTLISGSIPVNANACIAVSQIDRAIHRAQGISEAKVHHIPNGLDLSEFQPMKRTRF